MPTKTLLIFDLDGTLIDSVADLTQAVNFALNQQNIAPKTCDDIRQLIGNGAYALCQSVANDTAYCTEVDDIDIDGLYRDFLAYYANHSCELSTAFEGVDAGLAQLHKLGYTLAIATNKPTAFLDDILSYFDWKGLFALVVGGDSLPTKKPDPAPLLHICQTLGFDCSNAIMIGDSKNDILAGQAANITTYALSYGYNYGVPIQDSHPNQVFDHFSELVAYLI